MIRTELDVTSGTQQNIVTLDVTVNDAALMQMLQSLRYLPTHCRNLALRQEVYTNNVREAATFHILHRNPDLVFEKKRVNVIDDICMMQSPHYEDLIHDKLLFRLPV